MPHFEKNIQSNRVGLEQVKVLYETKKDNYKQHHIETKGDKEIIKDVINEIFDKEINQVVAKPDINVNKFSVFGANDNDDDNNQDANRTLEELVKKAFDNGVANAINFSFKTSNAYLIDKLHDLLVDKFYEALVNQKIIKK
ncbi:MAG TPA: hypothetical protein P5052_01160 [Candidatus Paceibacterota bacterium]|jgi:uncharacterized membrane protein YheB (UPF0754 family)|nr:hypothetical protein [Candidatus Paceibacterota bacterium]HRZ29384.1 hypothetical protein [Candidatus Paceibacterota bacterium]